MRLTFSRPPIVLCLLPIFTNALVIPRGTGGGSLGRRPGETVPPRKTGAWMLWGVHYLTIPGPGKDYNGGIASDAWWAAAREKGEYFWNVLDKPSVLAPHTPTRKDFEQKFNKNFSRYTSKQTLRARVDGVEKLNSLGVNVNVGDAVIYSDVETIEHRDYQCRLGIDPKGRFVIIFDAGIARYVKEEERLHVSSYVFLELAKEAPRVPLDRLKYLLHAIIETGPTSYIIEKAYLVAGKSRWMEEWQTWTQTENPAEFYAMLGTPHGWIAAYLQIDHPELGRRNIKAFHTKIVDGDWMMVIVYEDAKRRRVSDFVKKQFHTSRT